MAWENLSKTSTTSHALKDLWQLILYTLLLAHLFSCTMMLATYHYERYGLFQLQTQGFEKLSWISALAENGKLRLEDVEEDPSRAYVYAFYWSLMTLTTVGYGDIAPQNHTEHVAAVVIMLIAGFFWAWVLGTFCNITVSLNESSTAYKQACDNLNRMIKEEGMSTNLAGSLRLYMRRARHVMKTKQNEGVVQLLSPELQGRVVFESLGSGWLPQTPLIGHGQRSFVVDISRVMQLQLFCIMEKIQEHRTLIVVRHGICVRGGQLLRKDSVWGDDLILDSAHLRDERSVVCLTFTETNLLFYDALMSVLARRPRELPRIRKYLVRLTCRRGIVYLAKMKLYMEIHGGASTVNGSGRMRDYVEHAATKSFANPAHAHITSTSNKRDLFASKLTRSNSTISISSRKEERQPGSATAPLPLPSQGSGRQMAQMANLKRQMSQQRQMTIARIRAQKLGGVADIRGAGSAQSTPAGSPLPPVQVKEEDEEASDESLRNLDNSSSAVINL
jgi:hypothetical protein